MKLRLIIDGIPHEIDSTHPHMLANWIVEIFGRIQEITPATLIEFQAYPSDVWINGIWTPDWIADSKVIAQYQSVRSPRELVKALADQIDWYEEMQ